jgi:hypothetical protein
VVSPKVKRLVTGKVKLEISIHHGSAKAACIVPLHQGFGIEGRSRFAAVIAFAKVEPGYYCSNPSSERQTCIFAFLFGLSGGVCGFVGGVKKLTKSWVFRAFFERAILRKV